MDERYVLEVHDEAWKEESLLFTVNPANWNGWRQDRNPPYIPRDCSPTHWPVLFLLLLPSLLLTCQ